MIVRLISLSMLPPCHLLGPAQRDCHCIRTLLMIKFRLLSSRLWALHTSGTRKLSCTVPIVDRLHWSLCVVEHINPFSPFLSWRYHLGTSDLVSLSDLNIRGRRPRTQSVSRPRGFYVRNQAQYPTVVPIAPSIQMYIFHPQSFRSS